MSNPVESGYLGWKLRAIIFLVCIFLVFVWAQYAQGELQVSQRVQSKIQAETKVSEEDVLFSIEEKKFTVADLRSLLRHLPPQYRGRVGPGALRQFLERYALLRVLAQKAVEEGLNIKPEFEPQLQYVREELLAQLQYQQLADSVAVSEEEVHRYYAEHPERYEYVRARQILFRVGTRGAAGQESQGSPEEARTSAEKVHQELVAGGDFAELAQKYSDDLGTRETGGDLGVVVRSVLPPALDKILFSLQPGEFSEPIKTPLGYGIFKVEEREKKPVEAVRDEIETTLRMDKLRQSVDAMQQMVPIDLDLIARLERSGFPDERKIIVSTPGPPQIQVIPTKPEKTPERESKQAATADSITVSLERAVQWNTTVLPAGTYRLQLVAEGLRLSGVSRTVTLPVAYTVEVAHLDGREKVVSSQTSKLARRFSRQGDTVVISGETEPKKSFTPERPEIRVKLEGRLGFVRGTAGRAYLCFLQHEMLYLSSAVVFLGPE